MTKFHSIFAFPLLTALVLILFIPAAYAGLLDIKEVRSDGGLKAWLVEDHTIPVLALQFSFQGAGSVHETMETQGLARIVSNTMDEGAGDLDSATFQKELQDLSISLSFSSSRDDFGGHVKTLTKNKDRAFELLKLALNSPRFDEEPLGRMIAANQSRIRSSLSNPDWIAARLHNDALFEGHSYALNSGGTLSSLAAITPDMLRQFVRTHLTQDRLKIGVAGDISEDELKILLDDLFSALPEKSSDNHIPPLSLQNSGALVLHIKDIPQTVIELSQPGIAKTDPDYHIAQIMNFVLGSSGFGSRLMEEIREKEGLTYGIYSNLQTLDYANILSVSTSTANDNANLIIDMIKQEWHKMLETGITPEELADAQNYLIGSLPLSLTSTDKIAGLLLSIQMHDFPLDYLEQREAKIRNATVEDVNIVAKSLLAPDKFTIVMVGKPVGLVPTKTIETLPNVE